MALDLFSSNIFLVTIIFLFMGIDMCRVSVAFVMSETFSRLVVLRIVANDYVYLGTNYNNKYGT